MKKLLILLLVLCILTNIKGSSVYAEEEIYVKALFSTVNVFKDKDVNTDFDSDGENLDIIATIKYGEKLQLDSVNVENGEDDFKYYKVKLAGGGIGYVLYSNVLLTSISSPKKDLDDNATTNKKTKIYIYEELRFIEQTNTLPAGEKIKILEMGTNGYSRIQYKDLDGDILTVYVKTADIETSGISRATIGAIIIIATTVSLVLVVFGIKGNRKRKQKRIIN